MKGGTIKTKNAQNIAHIKSINAKHKIESKHKYNTYLDDFDDLDKIDKYIIYTLLASIAYN